MLRFEELAAGLVLSGEVRNVHEYGVFVRLEGSRIDALCHKSEVSDARVMEIAKAFRTGDRVKVIVTAVDGEKRRVSVSMKVGTSLGRYVEI